MHKYIIFTCEHILVVSCLHCFMHVCSCTYAHMYMYVHTCIEKSSKLGRVIVGESTKYLLKTQLPKNYFT